jgi:hypothetical protein
MDETPASAAGRHSVPPAIARAAVDWLATT